MLTDKSAQPIYTSTPAPRHEATAVILLSLLLAWLFAPETGPSEIASHHARYLACGLLAALIIELRLMGFSRIVRADWVCLAIFYALSYLEFLFDQPDFDRASTTAQTTAACGLFNLGFLSIVISRHFWPSKRIRVENTSQKDLSYKFLVLAFWAAFAIGYLHIFIAVNFNIFEVIDRMMAPRFSQPWSRGRLGDWKALLVEVGLLIYLIPPIYGTLLALRKQIPFVVLITCTPVFLFTLFYGFSSGTRNIFGTYAVTFLVAYWINQKQIRWFKLTAFSAVFLALVAYGTFHMLEFRNIGLKRYAEGGRFQSNEGRETLFVDFNLKYLGVLEEAFPEEYDFLGFEIPFWAIVRPIPRAVWPGKPQGLSVSIEEATNVEQMSVATTWVGESYMAFGRIGVVATGVLIGLLCGFWNLRGSQYNPPIAKIIYASGFFAAALSMRSTFWFTTAILPTIAMIVGSYIYLNIFSAKPQGPRSIQGETFTLPSSKR